jgi:peptide methionine sulfoxide reductase MsrA
VPFVKFYQAGDYHQKYYDNNSNAPYCRAVIAPKLEKLEMEKIISPTPQH